MGTRYIVLGINNYKKIYSWSLRLTVKYTHEKQSSWEVK